MGGVIFILIAVIIVLSFVLVIQSNKQKGSYVHVHVVWSGISSDYNKFDC